MRDSVGLSLPGSYILGTYWIGFTLVGAVVFMFLALPGSFWGLSIVHVVAGTVFIPYLVYLYLKHEKHVYLSADGIKGRGSLLFWNKRFIPWEWGVEITRTDGAGLPSLCVDAYNGNLLLVPAAIARMPAFLHALRDYAPDGHSLLAEVEAMHPTYYARWPGSMAGMPVQAEGDLSDEVGFSLPNSYGIKYVSALMIGVGVLLAADKGWPPHPVDYAVCISRLFAPRSGNQVAVLFDFHTVIVPDICLLL